MKKSTSLSLYGGLALAVLIVLAVASVCIISLEKQEEDNRWIHHTVNVLQQVRDVRYEVLQMRTGRRSYWFTGDERYLEPYNSGRATVPSGIVTLKQMVSDNPGQTATVNRLDSAARTLINFWEGKGKLLPGYTREQMAAIIHGEETILSTVYGLFEQLKAEEQRLLSMRENAVDKGNSHTRLVVIGGIILLLIVVLVLVNAVVNTLKSRIRAGKRLKESLDEMAVLNKIAEDKNWVLSGVAYITESIQSLDGNSNLSQDIIDSVVGYLQLPAGAIYLLEDDNETLRMTAAVSVSTAARNAFVKGEGIVGTAALRRDISLVRNIPSDYWRIESAMGSTSGKGEIACIPLWVAENLKGIIELGNLSAFSERELQLLNAITNTVAGAIHTRQSRIKINQLLEQVQDQQEVLISQQEELRQTNEELSRQTQELQASEEELKTQEEELKQINAELLEKNEIVEHARNDLARKAQELEATSRYKSEFLANMSHELRTPLNSVLILAKLLSDNGPDNLTAKQVEYARIIHKSGSDLLQLINDILDLSKIEAGKVQLVIEDTDIPSIVSDLTQLFSVVAADKGVHYSVETGDQLPAFIRTDKQRLEQVLKNLLSNAFKFTPRGGSVTVSITNRHQPDRERIGISVKDTGIGISKAQQQLIFDAFQQADGSTSRQYGGTGLGLSISKELTRLLGGEIELESEEGKGSVFTILIPYEHQAPAETLPEPSGVETKENISTDNVTEQQKVADDRDAPSRPGKTILIIEDDVNFATILRDFARDKGYKPIVALSGDEGLLYARRYLPDAIILDIQLPVVDGWSLLKMIRADHSLRHIPVHIISAFDDNRLHTAGVMAYLKKPVDRQGLENTFSAIGRYLDEHIRKVLIVSAKHLNDDSLEHLFRQKHPETVFEHVNDIESARQRMAEENFSCVIVDIDSDIQEGIRTLSEIHPILTGKNIPLIIYIDTDISMADELQLKKLSDAIVRQSPSVNSRLKDELELFLFKVQSQETPAVIPPPQRPVSNSSLAGKKVLITDDDMRNVFALTNVMETEQMEVLTASDGREALDILRTDKTVDIVLMDIMMPEMDGYEAMRRIRNELKFDRLPVIALTAKAMSGDREKCIEAGASDYITKPVDTQKLLSLMRIWLSV